jgi:hypothetical protein
MKLSTTICAMAIVRSAVACVDFTAHYLTDEMEFSATLVDNGIMRCAIDKMPLDLGPGINQPYVMDCHPGYWAAVALVDFNHGVVRYAHHNSFDETFAIESETFSNFARWEIGPISIPNIFGPTHPYFRSTLWGCDYDETTWWESDDRGITLLEEEVICGYLRKEGWNKTPGASRDWAPDTSIPEGHIE